MDETQLPNTAPAEEPPLRPDPEVLKNLGRKLKTDFESYARDRRLHEMRWTQNLRQYLGQYDPTIEAAIPKDRSRAYPRITRIKCVSMVAKLMNLLFPSSEKNWGVAASPVPNLSVEDLQKVLDSLQQDSNVQLTDDVITNAVREFAAGRAKNLEVEIADQLTELGGDKMVNYVALCKKVLTSGVLFGMGVLKGPQAKMRMQRRWRLDPASNSVTAVDEPVLVPQFSFVPIWDYYPDLSAKYLHQMDGQFERIVMSRAQVRKLANDSSFFGGVIKTYLATHTTGNYKERQHESELKTMSVNIKTSLNDGRKYEIIVWDGGLSGHYLQGCGVRIPEEKMGDMFNAVVWTLDDVVIRASLSPWAIVGEENPISSYHQFIFEEDDTSLIGNGLPVVVRDSQLGVAATARMILDNSGVVCGPNVEINEALLTTDTDKTGIYAYKVWKRDDESPATLGFPAVREIKYDSHVDELLKVNELFRQFADAETFVSPATGGDMQKGPSEPFRTAAGASMLQGLAALPFRDVVRNFDVFTESVIGSLILFNKHFNDKESIKGDFQPIARGSTSLIAKEVRGIGYDNLAQSLSPGEALYIDWRELLKQRIAVRDMDDSVMVDDAEAARREQAQAEQQAATSKQQAELITAEIRKTLAEAVKNLTAADTNAAKGAAATYNAILDGLQAGVTPAEVAQVRDGTLQGLPDGVLTKMELENPPPEPKAEGGGK